MRDRLYTVYDSVAAESGPLFHAKNDGIAFRQFRALMRDVPSHVRSDYFLYYVADYDSVNMVVLIENSEPSVVMSGDDLNDHEMSNLPDSDKDLN